VTYNQATMIFYKLTGRFHIRPRSNGAALSGSYRIFSL